MTTCPNCGVAAPDKQAFCGNCGTDLRAARAFQASAYKPDPEPNRNPETASETASVDASSGKGNAFDTSAYDYTTTSSRRMPRNLVIWLVVAAIALVCFCCGIAFGATALYWFEPLPPPVQAPVPTPTGMIWMVFNALV